MSDGQAKWIVVDDTDPGIEYNPTKDSAGWTNETVDISNPINSPPPLYGTFHEIQSKRHNANLTFNYTGGSNIFAVFVNTGEGAIQSCTLDGQKLNITTDPLDETTLCFNGNTSLMSRLHGAADPTSPLVPQNSNHEFIAVVNSSSNSVSFDYLQYPQYDSNVTVTKEDVMLLASLPNGKRPFGFQGDSLDLNFTALVAHGDSLDFDFMGYSLGVYGSFSNQDSHLPSLASYFVDGNTPVNFTINNPTSNLTSAIYNTIVIQTPRYSLGQHHFHLDFLGNRTTAPITLESIIVQNITSPAINLEVFPSPSTSTMPSTSHSSSHHVGLIVGCVIGGATFLVLIIVLIFLVHRRRRISLRGGMSDSFDSNLVVKPGREQQSTSQGEFSVAESELFPTNSKPQYSEYQIPKPRNVEKIPFLPLYGGQRLQSQDYGNGRNQIIQPPDESKVIDLYPRHSAIGSVVPIPLHGNHQQLSGGKETQHVYVAEEPSSFGEAL